MEDRFDGGLKERLVSWKEIASYLDVSPRTAQQWEKEQGLPVHRLGEGERPRVFAEVNEIESWLAEQAAPPDSKRRTKLKWWLGFASITSLFLLFGGGAAYFIADNPPRNPRMVRFQGNDLVVFDVGGSILWELPLPPRADETNGRVTELGIISPSARLADVDGDGLNEIILLFVPKRNDSTSTVLCFGPEGERRWEFRFGRPITWGDRRFSASYMSASFRLIETQDARFILASARHSHFFPKQFVLLDLKSGVVKGEYWHPGDLHQFAMADLDGDGREEILLGGVNNPGPGLGQPAVAVLDLPFPPPTRFDPEDPFGFESAPVKDYFLFPGVDLLSNRRNEVMNLRVQIDNSVLVGVGQVATAGVYYHFDRNFKLNRLTVDDFYLSLHKEFYQEGVLDHRYDPAELEKYRTIYHTSGRHPNANSEEIRAFFGVD